MVTQTQSAGRAAWHFANNSDFKLNLSFTIGVQGSGTVISQACCYIHCLKLAVRRGREWGRRGEGRRGGGGKKGGGREENKEEGREGRRKQGRKERREGGKARGRVGREMGGGGKLILLQVLKFASYIGPRTSR